MEKPPQHDLDDIQLTGFWGMLPLRFHPYVTVARLDRPIGWWLLLLPGWFAIILGGYTVSAPPDRIGSLMLLFLLDAVVMRAAGCVINDAWDRNLDGRIERTRNRPLASRQISLIEAGVFTFMLGLVGLAVLLALPQQAILTGLVSLPLIVIYPLAKRIIGLPQIILGLTFGWGALLGWAAHGIWPGADALILYAATVFWIFGYDTIYAVQDMEDDRKVGINSSALTLGSALKPVVSGCYAVMVGLLVILGARLGLGWGYYAGLGAAALHLRRQISRIDIAAPHTAGAIFRSNRDTGLLITLAAILGSIT